MPAIALLGTLNTKLSELLTLHSYLTTAGAPSILLIDVGRTPTVHPLIRHPLSEVLSHHPTQTPPPTIQDLAHSSRNGVTSVLIPAATALITSLHNTNKISAIVSAGGSTGTSLATAVMRSALPIGFPKLMVSTVASGDTGPLVGEADVTMMYSVVDVAGSNWVLDAVFENAAGAAVGMARAWEGRIARERAEENEQRGKGEADGEGKRKVRVGISMFGVTTPCVDRVRALLSDLSNSPSHSNTYEVLVFHSTGHGGLSLERLIASEQIDAVIDLTLTEIPDHVVGGVMSAGPDRLSAALKRGIPTVLSVGACDMLNFGPKSTVPEKFAREDAKRLLYEHNPSVTLMRTSPEECAQVAEFVVDKVRRHCKAPARVRVLLPTAGVSAVSGKGGPFEDAKADEALFVGLKEGLDGTGVLVSEASLAINDEEFASKVVESFEELMKS